MPRRSSPIIALCSLLLLVLTSLLGIYQMVPPAPLSADAAADAFSAGRAIGLLERIATEPHPTGTPACDRVRAYIQQQLTDLGLSSEIQQTTAINDTLIVPFMGATVTNVVARLPGTGSSRAILLVAHYDSVPTGPGAADDGYAVALLLEVARALKAAPAQKNDVIFLFTDGEELALLGAGAFAEGHPLAKDVGLVLNFEARGTSGPVIMYETSPKAGALLREFGKAAPHPMASSLAAAIYGMMPNASDFSEFLDAGLPGFNFAFIDGAVRYHTAQDTVANLNQGSLQMAGDNALGIVRHFGGLDLTKLSGSDAVYFNPFRFTLVRYPASFALPLAILLGLVFIALLGWSLVRGRTRLGGVGLGLLALLASLGLAFLAVRAIGPRLQAPYYTGFANWGFVALGILLSAAAVAIARRWAGVAELAAGGLLGWLIALVLISRMLPAASYLLAWPALFALAAFAWLIGGGDPDRPPFRDWAVLAVLTIPSIMAVVPLVYLAFTALPIFLGSWLTLAVVLLAFLVAPHISWIVVASPTAREARVGAGVRTRRHILPALVVLTLALFVAGGLLGPTASHPGQDSVYYGLNGTTGKAVFGTMDSTIDSYTRQFLGASPRSGSAISDKFRGQEQAQADAPVLPLPAPQVTVLDDRTDGPLRTVSLQISSPRQAQALDILIDSQSGISRATVNGRPVRTDLRSGQPWETLYFAPSNAGITLEVQLPAGRQLIMKVTDVSFGLPDLPGMTVTPRPAELVPGWPGDTTQVAAQFRF